MRAFGRTLQVLGLAVLPLAMYLELSGALDRDGVADLLLAMTFGFAAFYLGRFLEGYAGS